MACIEELQGWASKGKSPAERPWRRSLVGLQAGAQLVSQPERLRQCRERLKGTLNVRYFPHSGEKADIAGGPLRAKVRPEHMQQYTTAATQSPAGQPRHGGANRAPDRDSCSAPT